MYLTKKRFVVPGEEIGVVEEFSPSGLTYEYDGKIRSLILGEVHVDKSERLIEVSGKGLSSPFPAEGSSIEGIVESMTNVGGLVRIYSINGKNVSSELTGIIHMHNKGTDAPYKLGDVVRATVTSLSNNTIWLTMENEQDGVLRTFCSKCGAEVVQIPPDKVSCTLCGNTEKRKLVGYELTVDREFSYRREDRGKPHRRFIRRIRR